MDIEKEIIEIKERNIRVEEDKAWEVSWTRRVSISVIAYIIAFILLLAAGDERAQVNALIVAGAYVLSTLSLQVIRKLWER